MKTLTFSFLLFIFLPLSSVKADWSVYFVENMPNNCSGLPTSYIVNSSSPTIIVKFKVSCNIFTDCPDTSFQVSIYLEQGNHHIATYDHLQRNENYERNITLPQSQFNVNEDAVLRIEARSYNPSQLRSSLGYFRAYLNNATNPNTGWTCVTNGTSIEVMNTNWAFLQTTSGCHVGSGPYVVYKHLMEFTVSGNFTNQNIIVNKQLCMGYSGANPNLQNFYGWLYSHTNSSAVFRTVCYQVIIPGYSTEWFPCSPDKAAIAYKTEALPAYPIISHFTQQPLPITTSGTVECQMSQGTGTFHWRDENRPSNVSVSYNNQYAYITRTLLDNNGGNSIMNEDRPFKLFCYVTNSVGTSTERNFAPSFWFPSGGGCPYIFAYDSAKGFKLDNNILHRSEFEENYGNDIKDVYKLIAVPTIEDSILTLAIKETEADHNYFDKFRLYAIDHSIWDRVVITENNDIAIYDTRTVISPEEAYRNSSEITNYVQYDTTSEPRKLINGDPNDSVKADYNEGRIRDMLASKHLANSDNTTIDSLAIIAEIEADPADGPIPHLPPIKRPIGYITIEADSYSYETNFASRENMAPIVIPFANNQETANNVYIKWFKDYKIQFLSVVDIVYGHFTKTEIPLIGAWHSTNGDILEQLNFTDYEYAELDSSGYITLNFRTIPPPPSGKVRDYVIEVDGHYLLEGTSDRAQREIDTQQKKVDKTIKADKLLENYPNPFNPTTNIAFEISNPSFVTLKIYDVLGKEVITLVNEFKNEGNYQVMFDGRNFSSGIYYYKLETNDFNAIKKMILIK